MTPTSGLTTTEAGGTASFSVVLGTPAGCSTFQTVIINAASSDTSEGTVSPASLTFDCNNYSTPQSFTVTGVDDALTDGNIRYSIDLSFDSFSNYDYKDLTLPTIGVTNTDNEVALPAVSISPASQSLTEGTNVNITISRTGSTASALTVNLTITPGTGTTSADYTLSNGSISGQTGSVTATIPAGSSSVNVNFAATDDAIDEVSETLTLALASSASYTFGATTSSATTIFYNDTAEFTITPISGLVTTEAGGTATFTVKLNSQPTGNAAST